MEQRYKLFPPAIPYFSAAKQSKISLEPKNLKNYAQMFTAFK